MTVTFQQGVDGYNGTTDAAIYSSAGDTADNNGGGEFLFIGRTGLADGGTLRRSLVRFDLTSIPSSATIISASLQLTVSQTGGLAQTNTLYRLAQDWGEGTKNPIGNEGDGGIAATNGEVTWLSNFHNTSTWTSPGAQGDFSTTPSAAISASITGTNVWSSAQLAQDIQGFVDGSIQNFGWIIIGNETVQQTAYRYHSSEGLVSGRPLLTVEYTAPPEPIDDPIPATIPPADFTVDLTPVASGLTAPLGLADPDDGTGRLFIYDQAGQVWIVQNDTRLTSPLLDVSSRMVTLQTGFDERGFIGFALHPNFTTTNKLYTYTSEPVGGPADFTVTIPGGESFNNQAVIAEWQIDAGDANRVNPASRRELIRIDDPQFNHNGGTLRFGSDGFLYIAIGDGGNRDDDGSGHSAQGNGQDTSNVFGSILRIDVDNTDPGKQYAVPAGNPFASGGGLGEIFAYGLRNPFQFSFDRQSGDLYCGDVGQGDIEEVDIIVNGGNYGWPVKEGSFFFFDNGDASGFATLTPPDTIPSGLIDPIAEYDHDEGISVIGGFVYRGPGNTEMFGRYVFGEFSTGFGSPAGRLFILNESNGIEELLIGELSDPLGKYVKGMGEDAQGNIYVCVGTSLAPSGNSGEVYRIDVTQPPAKAGAYSFQYE